jgi:hypothetical protein
MRFSCSWLGQIAASGDGARPHPGPPHEHESKRGPPHPDPLLHKCVEEREMGRRARVLGIHARNSSANSLRQERELIDDALGESDQIKPNQTCGGEVGDEVRPHPDPPHKHESKRGPPHPDPLLHKCVEEREMERRARVLGIHARDSSANSLPPEEGIDRRRAGRIRPNQTKSNLRVEGGG